MYAYRHMASEERARLVEQRRAQGYPPHAPPHPVRDEPYYLLTAGCFEHVRHMASEARRRELLDALFEAFVTRGDEVRAWVVLPNHYHALVEVSGFAGVSDVFREVHARTSLRWNREDAAVGRRVWYRFADRAIRSERHYYTTLNYIHYNPVKHGCVRSPYEWAVSSVGWYLEKHGREWLRDLWAKHPLRSYGDGWDDSD